MVYYQVNPSFIIQTNPNLIKELKKHLRDYIAKIMSQLK